MSKLKTNTIQHTGGSADNITLDNSQNVTVEGNLTVDGTLTAAQRSNRNLIINGSMQAAQRGTAAVAETGYKSVDRWQLSYAGHDEALNQQQVDVSVGSSPYNLPVGSGHPYAHGFRKCFQVQNGNQTSGAGAGDFAQIMYKPEGQDINRSGWDHTDPNSKLTLSFWVKASVAQNYYGFIEAGSPTRIFGFETGTLVAHTWTKVTAVIPGYASLVIPDTSASAFTLAIIPFYGTNYTASSGRAVGTWYEAYSYIPDMASTWWTQNDATLQLTGVQLEVGSVATDFEHRSYGDELARSMRYYQQFPSGPADAYGPIGTGRIRNSTNAHIIVYFPEMRSSPTVAKSGGLRILHAATSTGVNSVASSHMARNIIFIEGIVSSGLAQGEGCVMTANNDSSGKITLSAEL